LDFFNLTHRSPSSGQKNDTSITPKPHQTPCQTKKAEKPLFLEVFINQINSSASMTGTRCFHPNFKHPVGYMRDEQGLVHHIG